MSDLWAIFVTVNNVKKSGSERPLHTAPHIWRLPYQLYLHDAVASPGLESGVEWAGRVTRHEGMGMGRGLLPTRDGVLEGAVACITSTSEK